VNLSDTTGGASIYYTTNGTAPTTSSTLYNGSITVSASETIEAMAVASAYSNSTVATAAFVINPPASSGLIANGTYTITNNNSGLVVDVPGWSGTPGTDIDQWTSNGGGNQKWQLTNLGNNYVELVNASSGLALEVQGSSRANGASIDQSPYSGGENQIWQVVSEGSGSYELVNENSGLVLDVPGRSGSTGTLLDQWSANGGTNQLWSIQ
jgi:hypothetical protein